MCVWGGVLINSGSVAASTLFVEAVACWLLKGAQRNGWCEGGTGGINQAGWPGRSHCPGPVLNSCRAANS